MIHTVHLDDKYINVKELLEVMRGQKQGVRFENYSIAGNVLPEEYMTSEEFWEEADKRIIRICKQYGVL